MKCKYDKCDNDAVGASAFCCASHRAQQSRRNKTSATPKLLPTEALERLERAAKPSGGQGNIIHLCPAVRPKAGKSDTQLGQAIAGTPPHLATIGITPKDSVNRPPCTADQLTSSCLACVDKPTCSYLHNMNSAVPGAKDYIGVA